MAVLGDSTATKLTVLNGITGDGANITNLNASNIASGTLDAARLALSGATAGSYGLSANATPAHGADFNVPYITVDDKGRITSISTKTVTLPSDNNTDIYVRQSLSETSSWRKVLLHGAANSINGSVPSTTATEVYAAAGIEVLPSTGTIKADALATKVGSSADATANGLNFYSGSTIKAHIGSNASGGIGVYASNVIYLRPSINSMTISYGLTISTTSVVAASNNTVSLGSSSLQWSNVYSITFTGALNGGAKYVNLYEARGTTTTLNKAAGYVATGAMFHIIASSSTTTADNAKPPMGDSNILLMNWDTTGGYDAQLAISTNANRMEFRDRPSTSKAWQEVAHAPAGAAVGSTSLPVYMNATGVITAITGALANDITGNAATASKLTNITGSDAASSSATWRRMWFSYNDNVTGRPSYDDDFAYQTSTKTLKVNNIAIQSATATGNLYLTGDAYLNNETYAHDITTDTLLVLGNASFTNTISGNIATADKVNNDLVIKLKSGTTEGTDLYTFNGSTAKTLDIILGTNVTLTAAAGSLTIASTNTKNTAGSTNTSSKIFLIGATSQAANPQTYSDDEVFATSGVLTAKTFNSTSLSASYAVSTDASKNLVSTDLTTSSPSASGTGIAYIATISQSATGKITATKSTVRTATTALTGVLQFTTANTNAQLATLPTWTANPTDNVYLIRKDTGGSDTFGLVKFSTVWNYIQDKIIDNIYWANIKTTTAATYNALPEIANIKINGDTAASAASTKNVLLVYDATLEVLNFVFA